MKRVARIGIVVLILICLLTAGARWYLTSRPLANKVTAQIAELYGGEVKIDGVDVWLGNSSVTGLHLFEEEAPANAKPWLSVGQIDLDRSVFDFLGGEILPKHIVLADAKVLLRFDENGKLLTRLPSKLTKDKGSEGSPNLDEFPKIELKNSTLTIRQGDAEFALDHVNAKLVRESGRLVLNGNLQSEIWGKWTLKGNTPADGSHFELLLNADAAVDVNQPMLTSIPFLPRGIWKQVEIRRGKTTGSVKLAYDFKNGKFAYSVQLQPSDTDLSVEAIELTAVNTSGEVNVEDGVVRLRQVAGDTLGGKLRVDADMDFRSAVTRLQFEKIETVEGNGLFVERFPKSWNFPPKITGKLDGKAALQVSIHPETPTTKSRIITEGSGTGQIRDAKVAGFPTDGPVGLELKPTPGGFGFGVTNEKTSRLTPKQDDTLIISHKTVVAQTIKFDTEWKRTLERNAAGFLAMLIATQAEGVVKDKKPGEPGKAKTSYFDIDLKMKDLDLSKFTQDLEFKLPFELLGKVSFQVKISIPVGNTADLRLYKLNGAAQLTDFVMGDLRLDALEAKITFLNGILAMEELKGRMPADPAVKDRAPATFAGRGTFQIEPIGDLKVNIALDRIPLSQVAKIGGAVEPIQGEISGTMEATVSGKEFKNPNAWTATAKVSSERVVAFGWTLEKGSASARLAKGKVELENFQATLEGAKISANAAIELNGDYPFKGRFVLKDADLSALQRLKPEWRPPVTIAGTLQTAVMLEGTAAPFTVKASGVSDAADLAIEKFSLKNASIHWEVEPDRIKLSKVEARLYEGTLSGAATLPFDRKTAGSLDVRVEGLDAGALAAGFSTLPFKITGKIAGNVKGTIPPAEGDATRTAALQIDIKAPKLRVQNIPTEQLQGVIDYKAGVFDYRLEGKSLGGTFELKGKAPQPAIEEKSGEVGRLEIRGIQINRLLDALDMGEEASVYRGSVSADMTLGQVSGETLPDGIGRIRVSNLRYRDTLLASEASGDLLLRSGQLRLRDFNSSFGEGIIRAQLNLNFKHMDQSWFNVSLDRVEASRLLAPWLGDLVKGHLQARIRGKLGREWSGTADLEIGRVRIGGIEATQWRLPVHFRYSPQERRGRIDIYESSAQIGAGRITGKCSLDWGYSVRLEGQLRFNRIDVEAMLRSFNGPARVAGGVMTGRFDFSGRDMRSLNDLVGKLHAKFEQSQAMNIAVLKQISPFLGINPSTMFQKGELHARLAGGAFRIEGLGLEGNNASLFVEGTVTLAGRLDLDVEATTANLGIDPRLRLLGVRIPPIGPLPLVIAQEAAALLSNRVIVLQVTGTVSSPNIRVLPIPTITQGAIRYLINRSFGVVPFSP